MNTHNNKKMHNKPIQVSMQKLVYYADSQRHLVCSPYSVENLHRMAEDLGIKRCWFHKNHYDIPKRKISFVRDIAKKVTSRQILEIIQSIGEWVSYLPVTEG